VTALERVLEALPDARQQGNQWMARCPAHDDKRPSLSVLGVPGRALVKCHVGCQTVDVVAALGLRMADLFDEPRGVTYTYDNGRQVHRSPDKRFHQSGNTAEAELYKLAAVRQAVAAGQTVYLVEGEQDADALAAEGVTATTSPQGAGSWHKVDATPLAGATVVIVADRDDAGLAYAAKARASLVALGCVVILVHAAKGKDATDHLLAGYGVDEFVPVDQPDGAALLNQVEAFLARFVAYPSEHALVAHTLWAAHAHRMDAWESTPRIAFLSPEPGSGKSRALEVTELLVPRPVHAVNTTPAYLFRKVGDEAGAPTLLYDEIDTVFGPRAKDNEDIRGMLNAGHRKGAVAGRCVVRGKVVETEELPAYCAVALAGLNDLPDTLASRSILVRMRRRAPDEHVEPFRLREHADDGHRLRDQLAEWMSGIPVGAYADMPAGVQDRDADVWEALLVIADQAGGEWPERARRGAVALVADSKAGVPSMGIQLLADLRTAFDQAGADSLTTESILEFLLGLDESPWDDLRGKSLNPRGLSRRLGSYGIKPKRIRIGANTFRGYEKVDLVDAWSRYLPSECGGLSATLLHSSWGQTIMETGDGGQLGTPAYESATSATPPHGCAGPGVCRTVGCPVAAVPA
jgi:hypothetical protein